MFGKCSQNQLFQNLLNLEQILSLKSGPYFGKAICPGKQITSHKSSFLP